MKNAKADRRRRRRATARRRFHLRLVHNKHQRLKRQKMRQRNLERCKYDE